MSKHQKSGRTLLLGASASPAFSLLDSTAAGLCATSDQDCVCVRQVLAPLRATAGGAGAVLVRSRAALFPAGRPLSLPVGGRAECDLPPARCGTLLGDLGALGEECRHLTLRYT